ncbi:MAG: TetR/AcrR family transcriptional regulator [Phocaeicola sp.]|uniref:TetR/AcrR family transcriptional regulator n=1 Tax=Phocaeicola TaxID=909656 RepID=UPI00234EF522|nr:TetR/AcrR family transcriptional regulator [Phocaeicola oris]MCE2617536.1 TetR/AcrR family transcriptional regulator [Phocaeicola oris]
MSLSKTRAKLVDVARQLFAKNGVDNTTMNDIAAASKKGRRTLYTYFKSKEAIYSAVVESELEKLSDAMEEVGKENIRSDEKILKLIKTHLDAIKVVVYRNGTLRAGFFRNIWRVEGVRKNFDNKEINLFRRILTDGVEQGIFNIEPANVEIMAGILHYCIKGIEVPYIRDKIAEDIPDETAWSYVAKVVYGALGRQPGLEDNNINYLKFDKDGFINR